jgi:hypothetical protein
MATEPSKPWWQMTRTPTPGLVLAGCWTLYGVLKLWGESDGTVSVVVDCGFVVMGLAYLASSVALLRRRRAAAAAPDA